MPILPIFAFCTMMVGVTGGAACDGERAVEAPAGAVRSPDAGVDLGIGIAVSAAFSGCGRQRRSNLADSADSAVFRLTEAEHLPILPLFHFFASGRAHSALFWLTAMWHLPFLPLFAIPILMGSVAGVSGCAQVGQMGMGYEGRVGVRK